jgi:NTP pyrophosphatase (non-canonical NTP hydrolase)
MTALDFDTLRSANSLRNIEWNTGSEPMSLAFRGVELAGEVGEACNLLKKLERERLGVRGSRASMSHVAEELADVIICVDLIAMQLGINLGRAVAEKFNMTSEKYGLSVRLEGGFHHTLTALCTPGRTEHEFTGWAEFDDGRGGEQVCKYCGMGAMAYTLRTGP